MLALATVAGCTGDGGPADGAAAEPPERSGPVERIDACDLVPRRAVRAALDQPVRVVGRELEPPTLPTETCLWGREFGVAQVEVQVTPGPVAEDTFEAAFGPAAGDDPSRVDVGAAAYAREGLTSRTLQVFDDGVVLSLEARDSPGDRLPEQALTAIARTALRRLPSNPELADADPPGPCSAIDEGDVAAAMRTEVRLRSGHVGASSERAEERPAMCSWAGLPGHVVLTIRTDPVQMTNFRANLSPRVYERVEGIPAEAWSQNNHAGDLLLFLENALVEVTVLPGEGFSSPDVRTTTGEKRLARGLVRSLG